MQPCNRREDSVGLNRGGFYNESPKYFSDTQKLASALSKFICCAQIKCQLLSQLTILTQTHNHVLCGLVYQKIISLTSVIHTACMIVRQIQQFQFELLCILVYL